METIRFEWDENKNETNKKKHRVSFDEAATVFYDEEALLIDDEEHSQEEERFILLGFSKRANLLVVCHCCGPVRSFGSYRPERRPIQKRMRTMRGGNEMKEEYNFSNARKNPYAKKLKKQVTINLDNDTIEYFKEMARTSGIPYQTLINLYLSDCAVNGKKLNISWN